MYHYSKLIKNEYGYDFYKMPVLHFDYQKSAAAKENFQINTYKKKRIVRKVKREEIPKRMGDEVKKMAERTPGPWNYELKMKWIKGPNGKEPEEPIPKGRKEMYFRWKGVPKENRNYQKAKIEKSKKPDMSTMRNSYIDHIFKKGNDKKYPMPGPGAHFLDDQLIKKVKDPDAAQKMTRAKSAKTRPDFK